MKYLKTLILAAVLLISTSSLFALPNYFYGNIAIKTDGTLVTSSNIQVRITIYDGATLLYQETFNPVAVDAFGAFTVNVGTGTLAAGTWPVGDATSNMKTKAEIDYGFGWVSLGSRSTMQIIYASTTGFSGDPSEINVPNGEIIIGDASGVGATHAVSGDATISNTGVLTLANSGVTAGSYGDATHYPTFTVDSKGRLTLAGQLAFPAETDPVWTAAISGNTTITGNWTFNNTITGSITGNSATATALQNARNFSISGDVTAPVVSFDGTGNVVLNSTIANSAVTSAKIDDGTIVPTDVDLTVAGWNFTNLQQGGNNVLTTATTFGGDVSGTYNSLQLGTGVVTTAEIANGTILPADMSAGDYSSVINTGTYSINISGNAATATAATNLAGGTAGSLPYQSAANTTTFLNIGTANTILTSTGSAPQWVSSLTDAQVADNLTINGGTITNTPINSSVIGASTPAAGTFTTLNATTSNLGTVASGVWQGTAIADAYVADNITIDQGTVTTTDNKFKLQDNGDVTKQAQFELSGITTGTTRTYNLPDANGTLALTSSVTLQGAYDNGSTITTSGGNDITVNGTEQVTFANDKGVLIDNNNAGGLYLLSLHNTNASFANPLLVVFANGASARAANMYSTSNSYTLKTENGSSGDALYVTNSGTGYGINVANSGSGVALNLDNSSSTNPLAMTIADNGGAVKLSYESLTVSGNAATISDNVSVVYIASDNDGTNDAITMPAGTNGQFLYVVYHATAADNAVINGYTTIGDAQLTFVYAGGAWQRISVVE